MKENLEPQKISEKETIFPLEERCEIQRRLIRKYCKNGKTSDAKIENICAENWTKEYADNFDQVDRKLVDSFENARNEQEEEDIIDKIQEALEILDKING